MVNLFTVRVAYILTMPMANVLTVGVGKVLDIYKSPSSTRPLAPQITFPSGGHKWRLLFPSSQPQFQEGKLQPPSLLRLVHS